MATTLVHEPPPAKLPTSDSVRFVAVRANLLPDEIVSARQSDVVRKQVLFGLLVVVALLIGWFGLSWWQTAVANSDLDDAQHQATALQNQQSEFGPLVSTQGRADLIRRQLHNLMAADLSWPKMMSTLRAQAPAGVRVTGVTGSVTVGVPATSAGNGINPLNGNVLNASGRLAVGQLTINGTSGTKSGVAAYVDKLATVPGLAAPLITSVTTSGTVATFTVNVLITTDALGGRYSAPVPAPQTGGK